MEIFKTRDVSNLIELDKVAILKSLNHLNVVKYIDSSINEFNYSIIVEYYQVNIISTYIAILNNLCYFF